MKASTNTHTTNVRAEIINRFATMMIVDNGLASNVLIGEPIAVAALLTTLAAKVATSPSLELDRPLASMALSR